MLVIKKLSEIYFLVFIMICTLIFSICIILVDSDDSSLFENLESREGENNGDFLTGTEKQSSSWQGRETRPVMTDFIIKDVNFGVSYGDLLKNLTSHQVHDDIIQTRRRANEPDENDLIESGGNEFGKIRRSHHHRHHQHDQENVPVLRIKNDFPVKVPKDLLRIRGGNKTDTINYPYIAAVIINGRLWCAGAIVDTSWVVTAAHCLNYVVYVSPMKTLRDFVKVRVGSNRAHEAGVLVDVVGAIRHPRFEEEPVPHADVALLKLASPLEFSNGINLIKIYNGMREPYAQSFIVVAGWGATQGSDTAFRDHTPDLLSARLKIRTKHYCQDAYQLVNGFMFTEDFFCASLRNGTRDVCLFDAGAPAVQHNVLMGIMSFGPERCGHEFQPAVFIKAFYFREFVKATISAYKTPEDLISMMEEVHKHGAEPPLHIVSQLTPN